MDYYEYFPDFAPEEAMELLREFGPMILGILVVVVLVMMIWATVVYVLTALGLYHTAKRRGIRNPWLAWIPVADSWILGCISDQYQYVVKGRARNRRKILLGLAIAGIAVTFLTNLSGSLIMAAAGDAEEMMTVALGIQSLGSIVNAGVTIANLVFMNIALYDYYSAASPANNVLFLVLGILFGFLRPFFIFFNRKKDDGMPPRKDAVYAEPVAEIAAPEIDPWDRPDNE